MIEMIANQVSVTGASGAARLLGWQRINQREERDTMGKAIGRESIHI